MRPLRNWPIIRTITGKNSAGRRLHKILPFPATRERIAAIIRGIADLSPVPNAKDASVREKAERIQEIIKLTPVNIAQERAIEAVEEIRDLLDDGLLNDSAAISPAERATIRKVTSIAVWCVLIYEGLAALIGWPSVLSYLTFILNL